MKQIIVKSKLKSYQINILIFISSKYLVNIII